MTMAETVQHQRFATPSGVTIHVATWPGPTEALPLVLLHGIWDSWQTFEHAATRLAADRTVHAVDFRGHGESDKPADGYHISDYAADITAVVAQLGHPQLALLGFSLGSLVASALAAEQPAWLTRLILEDPPHSPDVDPRGRTQWFDLLLDLKQQPFEDVVDGLSDLNPTRDRATNEVSARNLINTADGAFRTLRDGEGQRDALLHRLARITIPTLILRADPAVGGAMTAAGQAAIAATIPHAHWTTFPATGHLIHAEREDAFVGAVSEFLDVRRET